MSNLQNEIGSLSAAEKFELLDVLWESLEADAPALTDEQQTELGLNMLDTLPFNEIKLDRSFVASIFSERTRQVVSQTVKLARKLNFAVVAEGIEEISQLETARELGCDLFQGFLIAQPLDIEMATRFIAQAARCGRGNPATPEQPLLTSVSPG
jgi:predicted signal transduction protein with EAL and GGDEF domain